MPGMQNRTLSTDEKFGDSLQNVLALSQTFESSAAAGQQARSSITTHPARMYCVHCARKIAISVRITPMQTEISACSGKEENTNRNRRSSQDPRQSCNSKTGNAPPARGLRGSAPYSVRYGAQHRAHRRRVLIKIKNLCPNYPNCQRNLQPQVGRPLSAIIPNDCD